MTKITGQRYAEYDPKSIEAQQAKEVTKQLQGEAKIFMKASETEQRATKRKEHAKLATGVTATALTLGAAKMVPVNPLIPVVGIKYLHGVVTGKIDDHFNSQIQQAKSKQKSSLEQSEAMAISANDLFPQSKPFNGTSIEVGEAFDEDAMDVELNKEEEEFVEEFEAEIPPQRHCIYEPSSTEGLRAMVVTENLKVLAQNYLKARHDADDSFQTSERYSHAKKIAAGAGAVGTLFGGPVVGAAVATSAYLASNKFAKDAQSKFDASFDEMATAMLQTEEYVEQEAFFSEIKATPEMHAEIPAGEEFLPDAENVELSEEEIKFVEEFERELEN